MFHNLRSSLRGRQDVETVRTADCRLCLHLSVLSASISDFFRFQVHLHTSLFHNVPLKVLPVVDFRRVLPSFCSTYAEQPAHRSCARTSVCVRWEFFGVRFGLCASKSQQGNNFWRAPVPEFLNSDVPEYIDAQF